MRKIVVAMRNLDSAIRFLEKAKKTPKKTPGVRYAQKYRAAGHFHCMVTGDFTDEVESELLGKKKNLAESIQSI